MKRTDLERSEREFKKAEKKKQNLEKASPNDSITKKVGFYIDALFSRFRYDQNEIFNAGDDIEILDLLEKIKNEIPEKQWDNIIKKAVKKTDVSKKDKAINELKELGGLF